MPNLSELLVKMLITAAIATGTALLQVVMKVISRTELPGKRHGLSRDDALFWIDWTIAAIVALSTSVLIAASQGKTILLAQVVWSFVAIFASCTFFPAFLRVFAYDPGAQLKTWGWHGSGWVIIANSVGMTVLLGAVLAGVDIYATE